MKRCAQNLSRIRVLTVEGSSEVVRHLRRLQACTISAALLPNLRWICLRNVTTEMMAFFARLLNPTLKRCTILKQNSDIGACAALNQLAQFCPSLEYLAIWWPLPLDALQMIATLPALKTVAYHAVDQWNSLDTFIRLLRAPKLEDLSIGIRRIEHVPDYKKMLQDISAFRTLKYLSISFRAYYTAGPNCCDIQPLLALSSLEYLRLQVPWIAAIGPELPSISPDWQRRCQS